MLNHLPPPPGREFSMYRHDILPPSELDTDLFADCETFRQLHTKIDGLIEDTVHIAELLKEQGMTPDDLFKVLCELLEPQATVAEDWIRNRGPFLTRYDKLGKCEIIERGQDAGPETIESFRLRLKASTLTHETIWRAMTLFAADEPSARNVRQAVQSGLAAQYAQGLYLTESGQRQFKIEPGEERYGSADKRGARQEVTTALLLSLTSTPQGAYLISSYDQDIKGADGIIWHYTAYGKGDKIEQNLKKEYVQVKSKTFLPGNYLNMTTVDALATGNAGYEERYTWDTAKALYALLDQKGDDSRRAHIEHIDKLLHPRPPDRQTNQTISWLHTLLWPFEDIQYGRWAWKESRTFDRASLASRLEEIKSGISV